MRGVMKRVVQLGINSGFQRTPTRINAYTRHLSKSVNPKEGRINVDTSDIVHRFYPPEFVKLRAYRQQQGDKIDPIELEKLHNELVRAQTENLAKDLEREVDELKQRLKVSQDEFDRDMLQFQSKVAASTAATAANFEREMKGLTRQLRAASYEIPILALGTIITGSAVTYVAMRLMIVP